MSDETAEKTQDEVEAETWDEATKETSEEEEVIDETQDEDKTVAEEAKDQEENKEDGEGVSSEAEEKKEEKEEIDYKAEAEKYKKESETHKKEAETNKQFADEQARQRAESDKKRLEAEEKQKQEELEKVPEEVLAYEEEYPEAKAMVEVRSKQAVAKALTEFNNALKEACGGREPAEFIGEMIQYKNQAEFERTVMLGYYDVKGNYVKGHPDVMEITRSDEFGKYMQEQVQKDSTFAQRQNDPREAISILNDYKKVQLDKAGKKEQEKADKEKEEMEEQMTTASKGGVRKSKPKSPDKYDEVQAAHDAGFTV